MTIQIRPYEQSDFEQAFNAYLEAFKGDPFNHWLFRENPIYLPRFKHMLRRLFGYCSKKGNVTVAVSDDKVIGIAVWIQPEPKEVEVEETPRGWFDLANSYIDSLKGQYNQMKLNYTIGPRPESFSIFSKESKVVHNELWTNDKGYWFLHILAIHPDYHGRGITKELLKSVLDEADENSIPCYLESSKEVPNIPIYERFGFKVVKPIILTHDGLDVKLHCMIREPRAI